MKKNILILFFAAYFILNLSFTLNPGLGLLSRENQSTPFLIILGTLQDAGSPHIACTKVCCKELFNKPDPTRKVVSLGLVDPQNKKNYIFEATPDFPAQLRELKKYSPFEAAEVPHGIFLTHAHIGHYTGLIYLGREAANAHQVPVYAMPQMKIFMENNGPWSQLVSINNIVIKEMQDEKEIQLTTNLTVMPFRVPHRDEYSETVGFKISGPRKSALFIPDIDKWSKWDKNILDEITQVDYAFIDATFFDGDEINTRDISEIPHPFVIESMILFENLTEEQKGKIYFIHFNHTNPLLVSGSDQSKKVMKHGFNISRVLEKFSL